MTECRVVMENRTNYVFGKHEVWIRGNTNKAEVNLAGDPIARIWDENPSAVAGAMRIICTGGYAGAFHIAIGWHVPKGSDGNIKNFRCAIGINAGDLKGFFKYWINGKRTKGDSDSSHRDWCLADCSLPHREHRQIELRPPVFENFATLRVILRQT